MKSPLWYIAIAIAVGGCSGLQQPLRDSSSGIKPLISSDINETLNAPFCATTLPQDMEIDLPEYALRVGDLERFEQSLVPYLMNGNVEHENLLDVQKHFEKSYFTPWENCIPPMTVEDVAWPLRAFKGGFGSNLRPIGAAWFQEIQNQTNFEAYGTLNHKGIALKWMDIRALPTDKPLYKDPSLPGEGYPFDMLQNSSLNYGEPVFVSHTSKDGAWSYIFTNSVSGWVKSDGVALLDDQTVQEYRSKEKLFVLQDNIPLYDRDKHFIAYSRIGMVLALESEEGDSYRVIGFDAEGNRRYLFIPKQYARIGVGKLNKADIEHLGEQMLKNTYGWGGMYGERDCSSMIRDMYTPFGIWLPRNSAAQAKKGEIVSFEGLSDNDKLALIKEKGIPFETIIYLKGHVLLYIGTYQGNVMTLHNIWGIRTIDKQGNKGRHIIGKAVISTLEIGSELENFDPANRLLSRAVSMNIFTKPKPPLLLTKGSKSGKKRNAL